MNLGLLALREAITQTLFVFDTVLCIILAHYIYRGRRIYSNWWKQPQLHGAAALFVLIFGHLLVRGWGMALIIYYRRGGGIFDLENSYPVALIGTVIAVIGVCWFVRVISPPEWGERGWIGASLVSIALIGALQML